MAEIAYIAESVVPEKSNFCVGNQAQVNKVITTFHFSLF